MSNQRKYSNRIQLSHELKNRSRKMKGSSKSSTRKGLCQNCGISYLNRINSYQIELIQI